MKHIRTRFINSNHIVILQVFSRIRFINEKRTESSRISKSARSRPTNEPLNLTHRQSFTPPIVPNQNRLQAQQNAINPLVLKIPQAQPRQAPAPACVCERPTGTAQQAALSFVYKLPSLLVRTAHQQPKEFGTQKTATKTAGIDR
jgi:hypothetical protein